MKQFLIAADQLARQNAVDKVWPPAGLRVAEQAGCRLTQK